MFSFIKNLLGKEQLNYSELLQRKVLIIDVRSSMEYASGHANNSLNIPVQEIAHHIKDIKQQNKPVITCCRSGSRSASAAALLHKAGIEVYNGGSWNRVQKGIKSAIDNH